MNSLLGQVADLDGYAPMIVGCVLLYFVGTSVYRQYFHPLSKYPGPWLWGISRLPYAYYFVQGTLAYKISELHERYGPVLRIAPNELTFTVEEAWQDIYGKPSSRNTQLRKDPDQFLSNPEGSKGLLLEPDDEVHATLRKSLSPGFSDIALRQQEPLINQYFDLLVQRLQETAGKPVDINKYFEFTTFDIIGDLAFGESFDCLQNGKFHEMIQTLQAAGKGLAIFGLLQRYRPLDKIILRLTSRIVRAAENKWRAMVYEKLLRRLAVTDPRPDFICHAQKRLNTPEGMTVNELAESSGLLLAAGSATTASLLTGVTYHLLQNPKVLAKLKHEIRSTFKSQSEITAISVNSLTYELAVLSEALRIFPPVPGNFNRVTPPEGCFIAGNFVPGNTCVAVNCWAASHSSANFKQPYDFIPQRWLGDEKYKDDNRKVVNPFSVGPRNCLGRNLAYFEIRVILARMVWNFDMEHCEDSEDWLGRKRMYFIWEGMPPLMVKLTPVVRERGI